MNEPPWYHQIWLMPLVIILLTFRLSAAKLTAAYYFVKLKYILWRNPALKDLMKLAGNGK